MGKILFIVCLGFFMAKNAVGQGVEIAPFQISLPGSFVARSLLGKGPGMDFRTNAAVVISAASDTDRFLPMPAFGDLMSASTEGIVYKVLVCDNSLQLEFEEPLLFCYDSGFRRLVQLGPVLKFSNSKDLENEIRKRWDGFLKNGRPSVKVISVPPV